METSLCLPCISSTVSSPSSEDEKDKLHMAGLGEKVIGFSALNVDAESLGIPFILKVAPFKWLRHVQGKT